MTYCSNIKIWDITDIIMHDLPLIDKTKTRLQNYIDRIGNKLIIVI